jgi:hypothetical protein
VAVFAYESFPHPIRQDLVAAHRAVWEQLAEPGCWWTGAERVAIAREVRDARAHRNDPPWLREKAVAADQGLTAPAITAVRGVAVDAYRLDRDWCRGIVEQLGDGAYVELVAISVCVTAIDAFGEALGAELEPLPDPVPGEPIRERPLGMGDIGAWVEMATPWRGANVGRALSLVPIAARMFGSLAGPMYAGPDVSKLVWTDRPLSRPQVELMASRVSAVNECFY